MNKLYAIVPAVLAGVGASASQSYAFTTDANGFPVAEASDTTAMLTGAGSAGTGLLNFMIDQWQVIVAIIVIGAIVGFIYSLRGSMKGAVRGR